MKIIKTSSVILLSLFFMWMFVPQLSAKHHHKYYKCKSRSSAFALNFNVVNPAPRYVEYNYVTPAPCYERVVVAPTYRPYVEERIYYPAPVYREQVIVERPYTSGIYIQPQFSFSYWH